MKIFFDTHVHLYPGFHFSSSIRRACGQLKEFNSEIELAVFCLTEVGELDYFQELSSGQVSGMPPLLHSSDGSVLIFDETFGLPFCVLAGRQYNTVEGLEVLGLGIRTKIIKLGLGNAVDAISSSGGLPVVPWGLGKWTFSRRRTLQGFIANSPSKFALADSANRPQIWSEDYLFAAIKTRGLPILAGSDPLPLVEQDRFIGTFGTLIDTDLDLKSPFNSILKALWCPGRTIGNRKSLGQVLKDNAMLYGGINKLGYNH